MRLILIIAILISGFYSNAQNIFDARARINKFHLSPAYAGFNKNIECFTGYRHQWAGIKGSPKYQYLNINMPLYKGLSIGLSLNNFQTGNFKNFNSETAISYKVKLTANSYLSFGINPGIYIKHIDISNIKSQGADPVLQKISSLKTSFFDIGAGIVFNYKKLYAGIYSPALIAKNNSYKNTDLNYTTDRHYSFHAYYIFKLKSDYLLEPCIIADISEKNISESFKLSASVTAKYKRRVYLGISYSTTSQLGVSIGGALTNKIILNYNYEFGLKGISKVSSGTHEISLGFLIKRSTGLSSDDIFPITQEQEYRERNDREIKELKETVEIVKKHFNKTINIYEKRIKELEKINEDNEYIQNDPGGWSVKSELKNIHFAANSNRIFSSSYPDLNQIVIKLLRNPELKVKFTVYTDNTGSAAYMKQVSKKRSEIIKKYLISKGVAGSRIFIYGKGVSRSAKVEVQFSRN